MWWMVVLMSTGLIGLGVGLLVRDIFWPAAHTAEQAQVGEAVAASGRKSLFARASKTRETVKQASARPNVAAVGTAAGAEPGTIPAPPRLPSLEHHWPKLSPEIEMAVAAVNQKMAPLSLVIGAPGQPTWSLHNSGFGDYRRVMIDRDSVAWLRLEIGGDLAMAVRLRAHEAEHAEINRDRSLPSRRSAGTLEQALTESLAGAFEYAVERHSNNIRNDARLPAGASEPAMSNVTPPTMRVPIGAARLVDDAVALVNRAFAEADAQLVAADGRHGPAAGPDDRALSILARGVPVGLMLVEPRHDRVDISVGVADLANFDAARRQAQPLAGLTVQVLAEAIATTAWPAIAAVTSRVAS